MKHQPWLTSFTDLAVRGQPRPDLTFSATKETNGSGEPTAFLAEPGRGRNRGLADRDTYLALLWSDGLP